MNLATLIRALVVWLVILMAESAQGALRRILFEGEFELRARQISVVTGAIVIFFIAWGFSRWVNLRSTAASLGVGLMWVGLTLAFEIALGRGLGMSWRDIASDYDLVHGGLMPLGLLAMALTPWAVRRLKTARSRADRPT